MKKAIVQLLILAAATTLLTATTSTAGVVLTARNGSKTFISQGKVKEVTTSDPKVLILDSTGETVTILDTQRKVYATGNVEKLCGSLKDMVRSMMSRIPPEQRKMMEQYLSTMRKNEGAKPHKVSVVRTGRGKKVAGYPTVKYTVKVDGRVYEEHYVTSAGDIADELGGFEKFSRIFSRLNSCLSEVSEIATISPPEASPEYRKIYAAGYDLLVVNFSQGNPKIEEEVVKVEKAPIPDSEFTPPGNYRKVSFLEMLGEGM